MESVNPVQLPPQQNRVHVNSSEETEAGDKLWLLAYMDLIICAVTTSDHFSHDQTLIFKLQNKSSLME